MTPRASTAAVREWARQQGMPVGDRGRLSPEVFSAYEAAHSLASVAAGDVAAPLFDSESPAAQPLRIAVRPLAGATGAGRRVRARQT